MCVASVWQHTRGKVAHRAVFSHVGKVPTSGNAFMEMMTDACTSNDLAVASSLHGEIIAEHHEKRQDLK